jgi:hypothetical protein
MIAEIVSTILCMKQPLCMGCAAVPFPSPESDPGSHAAQMSRVLPLYSILGCSSASVCIALKLLKNTGSFDFVECPSAWIHLMLTQD